MGFALPRQNEVDKIVIPVEEALAIVLEHATPRGEEEVGFQEALGRLLREDVTADLDMPPFPRSAVDGFALRASDLTSFPRRLRLAGEIPAGTFPRLRIAPGEAASIMTGAPVPEGADAVQMVEQSRTKDGEVEILEAVATGQNVAPAGSEVRRGDVVLERGTRLDPATLAVAATFGKTRLVVGSRPRVGIIATGDELVDPDTRPGPGQIRNCNGFALTAQCRVSGADARYFGVAKDDRSSLEELIEPGLELDVLLLSGGVSMGRFDLVEGVLARLGVRLLFDKVALKPGKPLVFGVGKDGTLVFGLPGNPVSTMVTFELFVRAALARLEGIDDPVRALVTASLDARLGSRGPRRAYLPGRVGPRSGTGALVAHPVPTRGSGDITAYSKANALLVVPEDRDVLERGEQVLFHPLDSFLVRDARENRCRAARNPS